MFLRSYRKGTCPSQGERSIGRPARVRSAAAAAIPPPTSTIVVGNADGAGGAGGTINGAAGPAGIVGDEGNGVVGSQRTDPSDWVAKRLHQTM